MFEPIVLIITFLFLTVSSYTDFRTREVPDWVSFAAVATGIGLRFLYSVFSWDLQFVVAGLLGFVLFYLLGCLMFYTGQWGGGDSKLLMGVGALLGFGFSWQTRIFAFLIALILVGAVYGLLWSVWLAFNNWGVFVNKAKHVLSELYSWHRLSLGASIVSLIAAIILYADFFVFLLLLFLSIFVIFFFYLFVFVKAVQDSCLMKRINPKVLTEGDWIAEDVVVNGKTICTHKDLGVDKAQIKKLIALYSRGKIKKVLLKTGIPFVPSFLLAFLLILWKGNVLFRLL